MLLRGTRKKKSAGVTYDADAQAFITAAALSDNTQMNAINNFVLALKAANIWNKFYALWPFVGGTATSHKWNLRSPLDTNAAYRLSFVGGLTHSATGVLGNGTNGYMLSFFNPTTVDAATEIGFSFYSRTSSSNSSAYDMGGANTTSDMLRLACNNTNNAIWQAYGTTVTAISTPTVNGLGLFTGVKAANSNTLYRNGAQLATIAGTAGTAPNKNMDLLAYLNTSNQHTSFSNKECALAGFHQMFDGTEALAFYNATQAFETALGRQV